MCWRIKWWRSKSPRARRRRTTPSACCSRSRRLDLQTTLHQTPTHIVLHGPIAYLETTTEELINDETANRVLQVRTDASEAQTRAILDAQRRRAATVAAPSHQAIVARHQAAQRLLQPTKVIIPFAERLAFPDRPHPRPP